MSTVNYSPDLDAALDVKLEAIQSQLFVMTNDSDMLETLDHRMVFAYLVQTLELVDECRAMLDNVVDAAEARGALRVKKLRREKAEARTAANNVQGIREIAVS